jgi:photosystem II stability/assembly factor-like uncharacterized protein
MPEAHARLADVSGFVLMGLAAIAICGDALAEGILAQSEEYAVLAPRSSRSLLLDVAAIAGRLIAVGERGHVLISDDQGRSWSQVRVPTRVMLTGVFFLDRDRGWAVGHDAVILRTKDGGNNWELVHHAPEEETPLFDLWFSDAQNGYAIGAYGLVLVTADGGTWIQHQIVENEASDAGSNVSDDVESMDFSGIDLDDYSAAYDFHLNSIVCSKNGRLYVAAEAGNLYRSDDNGRSWSSLPSPYHGSFFGFLPLADDSLLIFGLRGHLYRSDDAGASWQKILTNTDATLNAGVIVDDGTVAVVGLGGVVLLSHDGGHTFQLHQQPGRKGYSAAVESADGQLILVGESGISRLVFNDDD